MPNLMVALPNIGGALCSTPQFGWRPLLECRAVTLPRRETCWNYLGCPGVPQTNETISAASGPKFTILWGHVEEILLLSSFFPIVDTWLSCEDIVRQSCGMVPRWRLFDDFCVVHLQRATQHVSALHSKFALRPHHVWKYGRHPICIGCY